MKERWRKTPDSNLRSPCAYADILNMHVHIHKRKRCLSRWLGVTQDPRWKERTLLPLSERQRQTNKMETSLLHYYVTTALASGIMEANSLLNIPKCLPDNHRDVRGEPWLAIKGTKDFGVWICNIPMLQLPMSNQLSTCRLINKDVALSIFLNRSLRSHYWTVT